MQIMQEKKMKKGRSIGKLPMRILLAVVLQLFRGGYHGINGDIRASLANMVTREFYGEQYTNAWFLYLNYSNGVVDSYNTLRLSFSVRCVRINTRHFDSLTLKKIWGVSPLFIKRASCVSTFYFIRIVL
jgi:hypothetical protein